VRAEEALEKLKDGNQRFATGLRSVETFASPAQIAKLAGGQQPFAIVLACSDSRVPVETLFDQGPGDLFVIRVAGNIVAPAIVGSVEFAAAKFGTQLAVVMGHSKCGAVEATVKAVRGREQVGSDNLRDIVERIRPSVEDLIESVDELTDEELIVRGIRANVRHAADHLRHGSPVLEKLTDKGFVVAEAQYNLENGRVEFYERHSLVPR
jgi:carbonic anhydrase